MNRGAGNRSYVADVLMHNGRMDNNQPTLERDEDWEAVIPNLPVSYKGVSGGETVRGRQMEANTTGLMEAAWSPAVAAVTPRMRLRGCGLLGGRKFEIVNALDLEGTRRVVTIQVEEKR